MNAIEHLQDTVWKHPSDYAGFSPDGDYVIYVRNRDSSILENSNYDRIFQDLQKLDEKHQTDDTESFVYDFRAGHWAVGWVEYLLVSKDAPDEILQAAGETICALSDYPVYDETDYSDRQFNEICQYWENMSTSERIEYCADNDTSIFAARSDAIPDMVFDGLSQSESFY